MANVRLKFQIWDYVATRLLQIEHQVDSLVVVHVSNRSPVANNVANRVYNQTDRILWNHIRRWVNDQAREDCDG